MHYALNLRTFIYSHYFYTGLRIAIGVIGLTSLVFAYTDLPTAMTVCIGALCTSLMDLPSPLRHKFHEMLASVLLCSLVTLIISLSAPIRWLLGVMLVLVSFFASMMVVYGKKVMPLQFAALFVMTLSIENALTARQAFTHTLLFLAGGMAYLAYAMAIAWILRRRTKQQVLAEALFELARYIELKAGCYDMHIDLNSQLNLLVRQQVALADKQQASRDLLLRGSQSERDAILVQVHFVMLDLYESIISTHADYALLRRYLPHAEVLLVLKNMIGKAARDIESIAYAVTRKRASFAETSYHKELLEIEHELQQLEQGRIAGKVPEEALTVLRTSRNKVREVIEVIGRLHRATQSLVGPLPLLPGADMTPFLTQQKYQWRVLLSNLRWESPIFRFSLRVAMAVSAGLLVAGYLPYVGHGYWLLLTIIVILKPTFSLTKRRRGDRMIGTVIGCVLTAVLVHFVHAPAVLLGCLFVATAAAPAFVYVKYRYTAIAASMQILLQISLLMPSGSHAISERLIDTAIGTAIATLFSFVLPSWEYRGLPRLIRQVLLANQAYIEASRALLQGEVADDFFYRLGRKRFMDNLASLSAALARMLDEPLSKQRAVDSINEFIVQNYLVVAHIAAIRLLLRRHAEGLPHEAVNALLAQACARAAQALAQSQKNLGANAQSPRTDNAIAAESHEEILSAESDPRIHLWSGWHLLQRRLALLDADVQKIITCSMAVKRALRNPAH